jgi:uncharacterized iron-regulated protein
MKKRWILDTICIILISGGVSVSPVSAKDKPAYSLYNSKGRKVTWEKMVKDLQKADLVFFGESHNNPISHWLEYELMVELYSNFDSLMVAGAEMFEADNQPALNDYLSGNSDEKKFKDEARLWKNYQTDYQPLVDFAKEKKIPFIATNVPRKYASAVFKGDFQALDTLKQGEYAWIAPLPIPFDISLKCYQDMLKMGEGHGMVIDEKYPKAQALKDATMAYFIINNLVSGGIFFHINGSYHSDNFQGILWYINKYKPGLKMKTITTVEMDVMDKPLKEDLEKASYILVVPASMTKTY